MINLQQMQRQLDSRAFSRVIGRILANGRCHTATVRQRLVDSPAEEAVATGLALQRCCELTYGRSAMGEALAERLEAMQEADGLFGSDIAATAVAARALLDWAEQTGEAPGEVCEKALAGLGECQGLDGLLSGDVVGSAIVLWQLAGRPEMDLHFGKVHCDALSAAVCRSGSSVSEEFSRFAFAMAA